MNDKQTEAMIDEIYDTSKEDTLLSMVGQLYSRRMLPSFLVHGVYSLPFIVLAVYSGIKFFDAQQIHFPLMYAAIFICCMQVIFLRKVIYWQMLHKNSISREVKRLEVRIVELMDRDLTGRYLDDLRDLGPVMETIQARYNTVVDSRWPLNFEDDLVDVNGSRVWAERLALPLFRGGVAVPVNLTKILTSGSEDRVNALRQASEMQ